MTNTKTAVTIKKGDLVYLFFSWDNKGTFAWYEYVVDSAGRQQIHLRSNDGEMLKRRIYPDTTDQYLRLSSGTPDPEVVARELAQAYLVKHIAQYEDKLTNPEVFHVPSLEKVLSELRSATPQAIHKRF